MPIPLVATKLHIPSTPPELVPRPHLLQQLDAGFQRKVTLVCAPAGFGKTILVCKWLQTFTVSAAWLSLDETDNNLNQFLGYLVAALQQIDPAIGQGLLEILSDVETVAFEPLLVECINTLAAVAETTRRAVLVLDDYHVIANEAIHQALRYLVEHLPLALHIIITSRADPPLPLSRLRVRQQVHEIRGDDLRFTAEELELFFRQTMRMDLTRHAIQQVATRTEGWIAGVQLAALSCQGQNRQQAEQFIATLTGSDRYIADYLIEEVLQRQPPNLRVFLLQTSILERLSPALCDAVMARENSHQLLQQLESGNFFLVPLDNERQWYRYHHLFQDLLRAQLQFHQPTRVATLHQRACDWYAKHELITEALHHAFAAEDLERAVQLVETHAFPLILQGNVRVPLSWLDRLPESVRQQRLRLSLDYAWSMALTTQIDRIDRFLQPAERMLADMADSQAATERVEAQLLRGLVTTHLQDAERGLAESSQILQSLPQEETLWRGAALLMLAEGYYALGRMTAIVRVLSEGLPLLQSSGATGLVMLAAGGLIQSQRIQGRLRLAEQTCQRMLAWATAQGRQNTLAITFVYVDLGEIYREWNRLDEAEGYLHDGIRLAELGSMAPAGADCYLALTKLRMGQQDWQGAQQALDQAVAMRPGHYPPSIVGLNALQIRLWLQTGALHLAEAWAESCGLTLQDDPSNFHELEYHALCRIALAQGKPQEIFPLLDKLKAHSLADNRITWLIDILLLRTMALEMQGQDKEALDSLAEALQFAKPEGFVRRFVDEGEPIAPLLRQAAAQGIETHYALSLLQAFPTESPTTTVKQPLVEPLSQRELELLALVANGMSNQQIAEELIISLGTTKKHISNILGKLAARNRTEAVQRARELHLL